MVHTAHLEKPKESAARSADVLVFMTRIVIMMTSKFVLHQMALTLQPVLRVHAVIKRRTRVGYKCYTTRFGSQSGRRGHQIGLLDSN